MVLLQLRARATASVRQLHRLLSTKPAPNASSPAPPSRSLPELSQLSASPHSLVFRSLPYSSPPHLLFPPSALTHSCPLFTLRLSCPPSSTARPPSLSQSLPTAPPSLAHTTSPLTPFLTLSALRARQTMLSRYRAPYRMDLTIMAGKKKVHKSAVVRERCKRRLREAIRLVVLRGARKEGGGMKFEEAEEGAGRWLVRGYGYIATATLELYRHPLPSLVDHVRKALMSLKIKAENQIIERQLLSIPAPPPDRPAEAIPEPTPEAKATSTPPG